MTRIQSTSVFSASKSTRQTFGLIYHQNGQNSSWPPESDTRVRHVKFCSLESDLVRFSGWFPAHLKVPDEVGQCENSHRGCVSVLKSKKKILFRSFVGYLETAATSKIIFKKTCKTFKNKAFKILLQKYNDYTFALWVSFHSKLVGSRGYSTIFLYFGLRFTPFHMLSPPHVALK